MKSPTYTKKEERVCFCFDLFAQYLNEREREI